MRVTIKVVSKLGSSLLSLVLSESTRFLWWLKFHQNNKSLLTVMVLCCCRINPTFQSLLQLSLSLLLWSFDHLWWFLILDHLFELCPRTECFLGLLILLKRITLVTVLISPLHELPGFKNALLQRCRGTGFGSCIKRVYRDSCFAIVWETRASQTLLKNVKNLRLEWSGWKFIDLARAARMMSMYVLTWVDGPRGQPRHSLTSSHYSMRTLWALYVCS